MSAIAASKETTPSKVFRIVYKGVERRGGGGELKDFKYHEVGGTSG